MLFSLLVLIGFQLLGEVAHHYLKLPLPGPVIGMLMLAAVLVLRQREACGGEAPTPEPVLTHSANWLITNMGLLFVPAGVGIMTQSDVLRHSWLPILAGVIGSTLLSLVITGVSLHHIGRKLEKTAPPLVAWK